MMSLQEAAQRALHGPPLTYEECKAMHGLMTPPAETVAEVMARETAHDDLLTQLDTLRRALLKSQSEADRWREQCYRLKRLTGQGDIWYPGDILRACGIQPNTLEYWRHRYPAFPKPRPGSRPREWQRTEIIAWLESTGRRWIEPDSVDNDGAQ